MAQQYFMSPQEAARTNIAILRNAGRNVTPMQAPMQLGGLINPSRRSNPWGQASQIYTPGGQEPALPDQFSDPAAFNPAAAYDMAGAAGPYIDSRTGGIPGRVVRTKQTEQAIDDEPSDGAPFEQSVAFNSDDQEVLGSTGRRLVGLIGYVNVNGTMPTGYDAQSLIAAIQELVKVQVLVSGQIKDEVPLTLARDTGFSDRILRLNVILDPGAFNTTRLQFSSGGIDLPPAPANALYTVRIGAQCLFAPLSRQQRAMAAAAYGEV